MITRQETGTRARRTRRRGRWVGPLLAAVFSAILLYAVGFALFVVSLPAPVSGTAAKADGIVALTGEGGRLAPAVTLLEKGSGKRLLITGVNTLTSKRDLRALLHGGGAFDCCADLGFYALDTHGNAEEAARWVRDHRYASLIVVTADYHMPRSLVEFGAQMPGVKLVPYPVAADVPKLWSWPGAKRLNEEYVKYLASLVRVSVMGILPNA